MSSHCKIARWRGIFGGGKRDFGARPALLAVAQLGAAAPADGELAGDRKPEPSAGCALATRPAAVEAIEDGLGLVRLQAGPSSSTASDPRRATTVTVVPGGE